MLVRVALIRSQPRARLGRRISRPRAFPSCQQNIRNRETAPERPFRANVSAAQTAKTKREETLSTRSVFATSPWLRIHFAPLIIAFFAFCLSDERLNSYYCFILLSSTPPLGNTIQTTFPIFSARWRRRKIVEFKLITGGAFMLFPCLPLFGF